MNQNQTNQILTCIIDGMRGHQPPSIRGAAANALINSLDFTRSNFEAQQERDVIMQVGNAQTSFFPCNGSRSQAASCRTLMRDLGRDPRLTGEMD